MLEVTIDREWYLLFSLPKLNFFSFQVSSSFCVLAQEITNPTKFLFSAKV